MANLRVVIVDDEPLVRRGLRSLLGQESDVAIVGEARNGLDALAAITASQPDLVFLDVQMPGMDAFEVLAGLPAASRPSIIFVTAFEDYAIRAFDVHAVDYLLKPFDATRFRLALDRVRARRATSASADDARWEALCAQLRSPARFVDRLLLKDDGSVVVVLGECQGSCRMRLHAATRSVLRSTTWSGLSRTSTTGSQLRVAPLHRSGRAARAC